MTAELLDGVVVERAPVYSTEGASRTGQDYGNTYVEVDLTNQKVYLVEGGNVTLETDCVTGSVARGTTTPPGIWGITYKARDAVLRGPGYASPVSYWMPFNKGIGLHDATWRGSFGGTIYRYSGSHGCVNLPKKAAQTIFSVAYKNMPVICHY